MSHTPQDFGGDWTDEKLNRVRKYLELYTTALKNQPFRRAYIDAFAGTGYRTLKQVEDPGELMFPEMAEQDSQRFMHGSARIALEVRPRFHKYIFIEKDEAYFRELQRLRTEYPKLRDDIILERDDANSYLQDLCNNRNWKRHRAVVFLDPYGMQVEWDTIAAIAGTKAIDLWILFPLGVAVNRLLRRDGEINPATRAALDKLFGTTDWYDAFYAPSSRLGLFGDEPCVEKTASFASIGQYFVDRLKTIFAGVADNPLPLCNSRNVPLYLLCFAAGNPRGAPVALKLAQHVLEG